MLWLFPFVSLPNHAQIEQKRRRGKMEKENELSFFITFHVSQKQLIANSRATLSIDVAGGGVEIVKTNECLTICLL